jgi:hypothetical protein
MNLFRLLSFLRRNPRPRPSGRRPRRILLGVEALEDRRLLSCTTVSGYVFHDANNNGLFDPGETVFANCPVELINSQGVVVASGITDANGFYQFTTDRTIPTSATQSHQITFAEQATNWTKSQGIPRFDPSLGTLTGVEIINSGTLTGDIKVENLDSAAQTITATLSGQLSLTGPGLLSALVANSSQTQVFNAAAFDGAKDFLGPDSHDFGPQSVPGTQSVTLTSAADLALFTGSGSVTFTESATGTSSASSTGGNLLDQISNSASGSVTVIYHYIPDNCLQSGAYTIVEDPPPPGYVHGQNTAGDVTPLPGSAGTNYIHVSLVDDANSTNNDFGMIRASSVSGYVYYDVNNNGVKEPGEPPIPGALVTLTGTNDIGQSINVSTLTAGDGSYAFGGLRPGSYTITETQPAGWLQGKNSLGSLGGTMGYDQFFVAIGEGVDGVNYNFGELKRIAVTNGRPPVFNRLSKASFLSVPGGHGVAHGRAHPRPHRHRQHPRVVFV